MCQKNWSAAFLYANTANGEDYKLEASWICVHVAHGNSCQMKMITQNICTEEKSRWAISVKKGNNKLDLTENACEVMNWTQTVQARVTDWL